MKRTVSVITFSLLLIGMITSTFDVQPVKAERQLCQDLLSVSRINQTDGFRKSTNKYFYGFGDRSELLVQNDVEREQSFYRSYLGNERIEKLDSAGKAGKQLLSVHVMIESMCETTISNGMVKIEEKMIPSEVRDAVTIINRPRKIFDSLHFKDRDEVVLLVQVDDRSSEGEYKIPINFSCSTEVGNVKKPFSMIKDAVFNLPLEENMICVNFIVEEIDVVEKLFWHSVDGKSPTLFNETVTTPKPFELQLVDRIETPTTDMIYILVNELLYSEVQFRLDQYVLDVVDAGYSVDVYTILGGMPEDIRTFLQDGLSEGLVGCLFVGDVPEPWYEIYGCFDYERNEEFPMDLFYMDLDGTWTDSDDDGIYDGHTGDTAPEIWVGRLKASNIDGDEASMINNYFDKNHRYRNGEIAVPKRALIYIDDDWTSMANSVNNSLSEIYCGMTDVIVDGATTTAEDYKSRIAEGYEWVHLQCHGSSGGHTFKIGDEWTGGTVYSSDYRLIDPPVFFYQLFVCSGARYVEPNYLAGSCIFTDRFGLLAIGSTKTGSMLYFSDFYEDLAEGDCVGEAFRQWFTYYGEGNPCWFYGLSIIGDPTLIPTSLYEHELNVNVEAPTHLKPGDSSLLKATVYNGGLNNESDVELFLMINGTTVKNETVSVLVTNASYTLDYLWTPTMEGVYNVTAYTPPVPVEEIIENNLDSASVSVQVLPDILIVDDNDADFQVNGTSKPEFESALTIAGYDYIVWNESSMGNPPLDFLMNFKLVVWTCGDYWNEAVDPVDAATLESYIAQGGSILVEGEDIGYDHHADNFMMNVAHAIYQVDNTGAPGLTVTKPTHPVVNGLPSNFTWSTDPPFDDGVTPTNGGMEVIQYAGTSWTAVTVFEGSICKAVYCAFPLYCLNSPEQETLIINSVNWLLKPPRTFGWVESKGTRISTESEQRPSMATDSNGYIYVAHEHYSSSTGHWGIRVLRSTDNGETWSHFNAWYSFSCDFHYPSIAIDPYDDGVYVAYERETSSSNHDIYCAVYTPSSGWSSFVGVDTDANDDRYPSITSEHQYGTANRQYISYEYVYSYDDRDLMFAKSEDSGSTWSIRKLHGGWTDGNVHCQTSITTTRSSDGNDYIYIVYKWGADYNTAYDIVIDKSNNRGDTWTQQWVCDESSRDKNWPSITATHGGGAVVIAWHVYYDSIYLNDIQYAYSTDDGDSWNVGWLALEAYVNEETPALTVDGQDSTNAYVSGCIHIAYWRENDIYYRQAHFSSPWSWMPVEIVTDTASYVSSVYTKPTITTYRSNGGRYLPAVAWTNWNSSSYDVYYSTKGLLPIYIRADGRVDPPDTPISSVDNVTYVLTGNIDTAIVVERDNIVVDGAGFTLDGAGFILEGQAAGVYLSERRNVTIKNLKIEAFTYGIHLYRSSNNTIIENDIRTNELFAVWIFPGYPHVDPPPSEFYSNSNNISENNITNNMCGIIVYYSSNNTISGNNVTANTYEGILISHYSDYNNISRNNIESNEGCAILVDFVSCSNVVSGNNITNSNCGIEITFSGSTIVSGNEIAYNSYGVVICSSINTIVSGNNITNSNSGIKIYWYSFNNSISRNKIGHNSNYGIEVWESSHTSISGNNITNNQVGVYLNGAHDNTIFGNTIAANNDDGVRVWSSSNSNNISQNIITNNRYAVYLYNSSDHNTVPGNNITNNQVGVYLHSSSNNTISGNTIVANSDDGIRVWLSSNSNNISQNIITNNWDGIDFYESSNNSICHNNFLNNTRQAYTESSVNFWNEPYPSGGNFWSDFSCEDMYSGLYQNETGSDGLCDLPFVIDANNVDHYPLANPWGCNIAVSNVTAPEEVIIGDLVEIEVVVRNEWSYGVPLTFNVTVYANTTIIETLTVSDLAQDSQTTLTFDWDTTGLTPATVYVIRVEADLILGETNTLDNTFSDGIVEMKMVKVVEVVPCDQSGNPKNNFTRGSMAYYKVTINYTGIGTENVLVTVNIYDSDNTVIGVQSFQGPMVPGNSTFIFGVQIPLSAQVGNATVYANAFTDWPHLGGVPYCPEKSATFEIVDEAKLLEDSKILPNTISFAHEMLATNTSSLSSTALSITVQTSNPSYKLGEDVYVYGSLTYDDFPIPDILVAIEVKNPDNDTVLTRTRQTDAEGVYDLTFKLPSDAKLGAYTVYVSSSYKGQTATNNTMFELVPAAEPDIAVTNVTLSKTVVGQGYSMKMSVTVENQGEFTETFSVTAYADLNTTIIGDEITIGIQNVTLTSGNSTTFTFTWNTTDVAKGNYTISAYAHPVPYETDISDNSFTDGWIIVTIPGDVDGDGDVDIYDVVKITSIYGSERGDPHFNSNSDLDCNGKIEIYDVVKCTSHYGDKDS